MQINIKKIQEAFQSEKAPLIHCITNDITSELLANLILFSGAKPFMAYAPQEMEEIARSCQSLFLNTGQLTPIRAEGMKIAAKISLQGKKPVVIDCVGIGASAFRRKTIEDILREGPDLIKGNYSEMRALCRLKTRAGGVDVAGEDKEKKSQKELSDALKKMARESGKTYLATGEVDLVAGPDSFFLLKNGCPQLDWITGTGDIVGALSAVLMARGLDPLLSAIGAVSLLNISAERAEGSPDLFSFRTRLLEELCQMRQDHAWTDQIRLEAL